MRRSLMCFAKRSKRQVNVNLGDNADWSFAAVAASTSQRISDEGRPSWVDEAAAKREVEQQHLRSPEYRELHRQGLSNSAMGLYGGEEGFEKSHRIWVDPDNSHLKTLYNSSPLAKNIRYSRYGYFKREMHIVDIDKMVRHARMLPHPSRLLTDFLFQRVPLPDESCAAIMRFMRTTLQKLEPWKRDAEFIKGQEMFERMLATNIPPVEVGCETHAEAIRCCTAAKKWDEGWAEYRQRAIEVEAQEMASALTPSDSVSVQHNHHSDAVQVAINSNAVVYSAEQPWRLNANFFEAVLELCAVCERPSEAIATFREFLKRGLKPTTAMLNHMLVACSLAAEGINLDAPRDAENLGLEVWGLFDFFTVDRNTASISSYMRLCSMLRKPDLVLDALRFADQTGVAVNEECMCWLLYSVRELPSFGDYVLEVFAQATRRALGIDYRMVTFGLMYCATQGDGDAALALYQQYVLTRDMNMTPEMLVLMLQSFNRCQPPHPPTNDMLLGALDGVRRLERNGSPHDLNVFIYNELFTLCGHVGGAATGFSLLKKVMSMGLDVTLPMMNGLLAANAKAAAPNGSAALTEELVDMMQAMKIKPSLLSLELLLECHKAHKSTVRTQAYVNPLITLVQKAFGKSEGDATTSRGSSTKRSAEVKKRMKQETSDEDMRILGASVELEEPESFVVDTPPHRIRMIHAEWNLTPEEMILKKFGQTSKLAPKDKTNVPVFGTTVPFGRWPGVK